VGHKWVFKKKKDGRYRARLCALGYSQIYGEDYTDSSSPVVNDVTFRLIVTLMLLKGWESQVVDITTAFLHGKMEEQMFMTMPEGLNLIEGQDWNPDEDCAELDKTIYGTKQASRQYWKKFMQEMKEVGFKTTHTDACLLMRNDHRGIVIICVYVDDCFLTGDRKAIDGAMKDIEKTFDTRRLGPIDEYIGCTVKEIDKQSRLLIQPDMIKKIRNTFGDEVEDMRKVDTPMGPGYSVERPKEGIDQLIDKSGQSKFRSGVGMLLYLVKHSRPDLSNAVRELAKVMDGATQDHYNMMLRVIKFVLGTNDRGVLMKPTYDGIAVKVEAYVDSDYAGDRDNRRSITGYMVYFCGSLIAWKSKQQGGVTLSSSEAEYYAISDVATELLFVKQILDFLQVKYELPLKVKVDNQGAIYLANNSTSGSRTKHIDARLHFVRDLTQSDPKVLEIEHVPGEENQSDTFTKNTSNQLFWKHTNNYMVYEKTLE
jgi:hypothetical protein